MRYNYLSLRLCIGQDGELVMCYNSTTCAAAAEFANLITAEDCCLNNPDGLSFRRFCGSEMCRSCIGMCMLCYNSQYSIS